MDPTRALPGQQKVSVEQAFRLATEHHAAGRRQQAADLASRVVRAEPRHALAWQLLGVMAHEAGNTQRGIELLNKAIQCNPMISNLYANRAEMHRLLGNLPQAVADGEQAVRLSPRSAMAHSNLGIALYSQGDTDRAEACQKQALQFDAHCLPAINNLGSICRDRKDRPGAMAMYRKALAIRPDFLEAANNLGAVMTETEDPEGALKLLLKVVQARPNYAEAHCNIGNAFIALENFQKAEVAFNNVVRIKPDYAEAYEGLARCAQEYRNLVRAEQCAQKSIALKPARAEAYSLLGRIYSEQSFPEQAAAAFEKALTLDSTLISAYLGQGRLLMELGKLDEAEQSFRKALALDPEAVAPRMSLTQVKKAEEGDENFTALLDLEKKIGEMPETKAMSLHFALGKALEDVKRYNEAFPHFIEGCRLKRKRIEYSADNNSSVIDNICKAFSKEMVDSLRGAGETANTPIFVLGMPRSGTTLTETIIASHPDVYGAGELPDLMQIAGQPIGTPGEGYPLNMARATPADLTRMGAQYLAQLKKRAPNAKHITDKMPANFLALGLIHLMLPNAKIVHVQRNAVDTCVSNFTRMFHKSQYQSYDLRELGRYYRDYLTLMTHWHAVLPAGAFYEISYEKLVTDQEAESRKLIAYCGLDWNDACLSPDKTERNVKTASVTQVRQPVYQTSVERWRVYEKFLGPLLEELGDAAKA
ncbi:MAG: tetratricopeptide repeat-containing sulfotransferase family protein [Pseudomonadota bacterium]